jgi:hypothetical protein
MFDREEGKAVEKKEVKHSLEKLSDEELQALVATELDDIDEDESSSEDN